MPVLKTPLALLFITTCLFSSCIRRAYYFSPLQGNTSGYHAMPVRSDSIKSTVYADGSFTIGGLNDQWRDQVYSFQADIHRAHVLDNIRIYYGATAALGSYNVKPYGYFNNSQYIPDSSLINIHSGHKTFGAYGFNAGISFTAPMGRRGEWRYFGVEGSLFNELGDYYTFRKNLPDSAADVIDKKKYFGSLGFNTELVFKGRSSRKFGIKIATGSYLRRLYYNGNYSGNQHLQYSDLLYFSNTYHFTSNKVTTYFQFNIATQAGHFRVGMNYRL
jgi:hypothetical protein